MPGRGVRLGDTIKCKDWKDLKAVALSLSSEGYGVGVLGFGNISDNILTVTAEPENKAGGET